MILDYVLEQLPLHGEAKIWVDMCAAPGGKTGILAKHLQPADVLLANEVIGLRRAILRENLTKAGLLNTFIAGEPISSFQESFADIILVDAPCAGEGMMRKEQEAINQWNQELVDACSLLQKQIVKDAAKALKADGYLIYSTCSYSMEENIDNILYFQEHFQLSSVPLLFPDEWGIAGIEKDQALGFQLYPHKLKGEGLFIAVLKKGSEPTSSYIKSKKPFRIFEPLPDWLKTHLTPPETLAVRKNSSENEIIGVQAVEKANELLMHLPRASAIISAGELKGRDFVPAHTLATSALFGESYSIISVDLTTALDYLERNANSLPHVETKGWYVIQYAGTNLGWAKWTGQGWKNHYPMVWRLRDRNKK
jgi:NOL1/NOP2/fmu family ribosome biogenesis protein